MRNIYIIHEENNEENVRKPHLLYKMLTDKTCGTADYKS